MTTPLIATRDALIRELERHIGAHASIVANDLIASGVVVTPDVYLAGLANDEAMVERVARAINRGPFTLPGDRLFRIGQARDAIGTLAGAHDTPTTEDQ